MICTCIWADPTAQNEQAGHSDPPSSPAPTSRIGPTSRLGVPRPTVIDPYCYHAREFTDA